MKKNKTLNIISLIILIFSIILFSFVIYLQKHFSNIPFAQILYTVKTSEGTSLTAVLEGIIFTSVLTIVLFILIKFTLKMCCKFNFDNIINLKIKNKTYKLYIFPLRGKMINIFEIFLSIILIFIGLKNIKFFEFIKFQSENSNFILENYVDPKTANIKFDNEKKNLIYIYFESLETTGLSTKNGGNSDVSITPNLERLALNNLNFSNTDKLGGALVIDGAGWTASALVAQTSGLPLKLTIDGNEYNKFESFLPGAYTIGEILSKNGYKNYFMLGSDANFGGRKTYFKTHGDYKIYDYPWALDNKLIPADYLEWWGYEDSKLYDYAKDKLLKISKNNEPFNFTILTADTHFVDGYVDKSCEEVFEDNYSNSFYCGDKMIQEFINWIKEQDFYDNTVIIITGDHLTMQSNYYDDKNYIRTVYNSFINTDIVPINNKNRIFTTLDMYPTTLAALGATIDGDQLGLGVNLFSDKMTLAEKYGFEEFNTQLNKNSDFYNNELLSTDYYDMTYGKE